MIVAICVDTINSNGETNFPPKSLLANRLVVNLCRAFADKLLGIGNIKLSKTHSQVDFLVDFLDH